MTSPAANIMPASSDKTQGTHDGGGTEITDDMQVVVQVVEEKQLATTVVTTGGQGTKGIYDKKEKLVNN
jgi:hypothetical protein